MLCPHGVRFTFDQEFILVADAAARYVNVYRKDGESWSGTRDPVRLFEAMPPEVFARGRLNPQEGGPKGIDISKDTNVLVATTEFQSLAFFDVDEVVRGAEAPENRLSDTCSGASRRRSSSVSATWRGFRPSRRGPGAPGARRFVAAVRPEDDSLHGRHPLRCHRQPRGGGARAEPTPEQALALAIERHQLDQLDDAEMIYAALLERWPDHPDVLNYMGVLKHQRGEDAAALDLLRHAVEVSPDAAGIWNNLGNVLKHLRRTDEAERAFRRSIELGERPQALSNLGSLLRRRRQWAEGEVACRRAIEIAPAFGDAWHHLTLLLVAQARIAEAWSPRARRRG